MVLLLMRYKDTIDVSLVVIFLGSGDAPADAGISSDIAIQTTNGERVLLCERRGISAASLWRSRGRLFQRRATRTGSIHHRRLGLELAKHLAIHL